MSSRAALKRLQKELKLIQAAPPPFVRASPHPADLLTWLVAIVGPRDSPFAGGMYVGKIRFPPQYPMKPPQIQMLTPSGRFEVGRAICMSMTNFHPESWNPAWSVSTICVGFLSFMLSDELTTGAVVSSDAEKRRLAAASLDYNKRSIPLFKKLFPELLDGAEARRQLEPPDEQATSEATSAASAASPPAADDADEPPAPEPAPAADDDGGDEPAPVPAPPAAAPVAEIAVDPSLPDVSKMKIKELRKELKTRSVDITGCTTKSDLAALLDKARRGLV